MAETTTSDVDHRSLGVALYNSAWALLEKANRSVEEDDELLHRAHASAYHWLAAPEGEPKNRARSEWLCSRVYSVLGRAEPALHHAERCFQICEQHPDNVEDWDLAFAYEALARAHGVAGNEEEAGRYAQRGRDLADRIADPEDKEIVLRDYATL
jgi:tetratricopeptide (TPR) repeat protein